MSLPDLSLRALGYGALALALVGCGSSEAATTEIATLTDASGSDETAAVAETDPAEAALAFAQCMRDNGVDMEDPTFDADGNLDPASLFGAGAGEPGDESFRTAMDSCGDQLEGIAFGGGPGGIDRSAIEEGLVAYTSCLRDEGLVVDDLTFGGPGAGGAGAGDGAGAGAATEDGGQPGGFGGERGAGAGGEGGPGGEGFDPTARLVAQLGLDEDDPEVAAALDTCAPVLDEAFSGIAPGTEN